MRGLPSEKLADLYFIVFITFHRFQLFSQLNYNEFYMIDSSNWLLKTFGISKMLFNCLDPSAGTLIFWLSKVCTIFLECCNLSNIAIKHDLSVLEELECFLNENYLGRRDRMTKLV